MVDSESSDSTLKVTGNALQVDLEAAVTVASGYVLIILIYDRYLCRVNLNHRRASSAAGINQPTPFLLSFIHSKSPTRSSSDCGDSCEFAGVLCDAYEGSEQN